MKKDKFLADPAVTDFKYWLQPVYNIPLNQGKLKIYAQAKCASCSGVQCCQVKMKKRLKSEREAREL